MKLYTLRDVRHAAQRNPDARFLTARRDGPTREVGVAEAEEYFRNVGTRESRMIGRWFEVIPNDPPATN